jgi:type VI secretion system protein VasD
MLSRRGVVLGCVLCLVSGLAGCAKPPPPPPPPTVVKLSITTTADANPNSAGQGAPVIIRVYQLGSSAGFAKAEVFPLLNQDTATLGTDVVKKDEFLLPPGTTKTLTLTPAPTVKAIGVFAAYRDFGKVTWRGSADVAEHKTTDVTVKADATGIAVTSKVEPPPPAKPGS